MISPADRGKIEHLLEQVQRAGHSHVLEAQRLPSGHITVLSNGLCVAIGIEAGAHAGQGGSDEARLWLGVSRNDRLPNYAEMQALIALVFSASQRGSANPLSISTSLSTPFQVICSSRI